MEAGLHCCSKTNKDTKYITLHMAACNMPTLSARTKTPSLVLEYYGLMGCNTMLNHPQKLGFYAKVLRRPGKKTFVSGLSVCLSVCLSVSQSVSLSLFLVIFLGLVLERSDHVPAGHKVRRTSVNGGDRG